MYDIEINYYGYTRIMLPAVNGINSGFIYAQYNKICVPAVDCSAGNRRP